MKNFMSKISLFIIALVAMFSSLVASAQVTIPDTGVDTTGYITAGITALGAIAGAAIAGYIAFLLLRKGLRWVSKAFSG